MKSRWQIELEQMVAEAGTITPEAVVERARDPSSALHERFDWNNDEAGEKYRLLQARSLIRRVVVHIEPRPENQEVTIRAYVNVDRGSREYVPVSVVKSDEEATTAVLHHLLADLRSVQSRLVRYADYLDASDELRASIDRFIARNEKKRRAS